MNNTEKEVQGNYKGTSKSDSGKRILFYVLVGILITGISVGVLMRFGVVKKAVPSEKTASQFMFQLTPKAPVIEHILLSEKINNGTYDEAIKYGEEMLKQYPDDFLLIRKIAFLYAKEGTSKSNTSFLTRAEELFKIYIKDYPTDIYSKNKLAEVKRLLSK